MTAPLFRRCLSAAISIALIGACGSAAAQYVWLDEKGSRQFSDRPPPASVPASRILKHPGGTSSSSAASAASGASAAQPAQTQSTTARPDAEKTIAEKNAEFRKRQMEREDKERKLAEEAKLAADKARNCERAQDYQRSLESGVRISRTDKNGERTFLSDEQRERELGDTRRLLNECKS
ncbi:DUF4124 domain-containing protein [Noviherbaspirillum sp. CPCC 100848]|uniref:DUF4124 domain-containing protein n=1 Tax=Noviherbaspirillum album TaxID=3080276 RepID=A0ABU6J7C5_9BURK|nr:DUF4124 domain-containing protein [Noviherbaspirillum sp. CPCC 100848]MEC4719430.1 DUF4124 domain-containing protein [Noviherbaspirillum sp. CPCC 100848]